METSPLTKALRHALGGLAGPDPTPDAQLLERFVAQRDEAAFTALVQRHGPMVFRLCQRMLANHADVEDAFQATFVVLARLAGRIQGPSLASWLYTAARRAARDVRRSVSRRRNREIPLGEAAEDVADSAAPAEGDLRPILDEELGRLPERYRAPLVLCYLGGRSVDEAAAELGLARGTVASRMSRARDLLRSRLARRGLALSAPALAGLLTETTATAAVPLAALQTLASAALAGGPALREGAALLAKEALQGMFWSKVRWGGIFLACLLVLGTATVKWTASTAKPAAKASASSGQGDDFYVRWRFDEGPPKDIRLLRGKWEWLHEAGEPKVMFTSDATLLSPTRVPKQPFVLSVKMSPLGWSKKKPERVSTTFCAFWMDGSRVCNRREWFTDVAGNFPWSNPSVYRVNSYFMDGCSVEILEELLSSGRLFRF